MNQMDENVKQEIINHLMLQDQAKLSLDGKQVNMRCVFCGDSRKNPKHTNFSVKIDTENGPMVYQCFRQECRKSGIVDEQFLSEKLSFNKYQVIHELNKFNRSISGYKKHSLMSKYIKKELTNVITTRDEVSGLKLKYINNRLGTELSYKDIFDLKINLNFKELLDFNEIKISAANDKELYKKTRRYELMDKYGIVFLSIYNDFAIIRDLTNGKKIGNRYITENIFNNYEDVCKYYIIPTNIDILSPDRTVINVAEGCMDILSVYYNLDIDRKHDNQIFAAANGAGVVNLVSHIVREYGLMDLKINIFADSDVNIKTFDKLKKLKKYTTKLNITIYYNTYPGEKDFGVPRNRIEYSKYKLI